MLTSTLLTGLRSVRTGITSSRNIGLAAPVLAKAGDPIQQLFLDKVQEYKQKSSGGKLVDASPEIQRELKQELEKLERIYGAPGQDMTQFPTVQFQEPKLDSINQQ